MKNTIILLASLIVAAGCKQEYVKEPKELPNVKQAKVVSIEATDQPIPVYASGKIEALKNMKLSFKTGGYVKRIAVNEGDYVKKGQLLATLNTEEIDAQVKQAEANVTKAERDLERFKRLYADSAATLEQVQDLETGLEVAQSGLTIARFNRVYSQIIAPVSGRIQTKMAEVNELVNPGQPILAISAKSAGMSLNVGLADREVVKLKTGDQAEIIFDAYDGTVGRAQVTEIAAEASPLTGTFNVELTILDFPFELKSGFFAKASILPGKQGAYFKVPMHAMVSGRSDEVAVFVPDINVAKKRSLKPLFIGDDFFTVAAVDLQQELSVITDGASYLAEGERFEKIN